MKTTTRAMRMAQIVEEKLIETGQLVRQPRKAQPDRETPSQIEKRRLLKAKLRSFVQD